MKSAISLDQRLRREVRDLERFRRGLALRMHLFGYSGPEGQWAYGQRGALKRRGAPTSLRSRCVSTGRSAAVFRAFRRSRMELRQRARAGQLAQARKVSW